MIEYLEFEKIEQCGSLIFEQLSNSFDAYEISYGNRMCLV